MPPKSSQVPARSSGPAIRGLRGGARVRAHQTRLPVGPAPSGNDHITTIGVKRTAFGAAGRKVKIISMRFLLLCLIVKYTSTMVSIAFIA